MDNTTDNNTVKGVKMDKLDKYLSDNNFKPEFKNEFCPVCFTAICNMNSVGDTYYHKCEGVVKTMVIEPERLVTIHTKPIVF